MKKCLALLLSLLCVAAILTCAVAYAKDPPTLTVGTVDGQPGETVQVPITISNNSGVVALDFHISYDATRLALTQATNGTVFSDDMAMFGNAINANPYTLLWVDELSRPNYTGNGVVATLTFTVLEAAQDGAAAINLTVEQGSTFDVDLSDVVFSVVNGAVTVAHPVTNVDLVFHTSDDDYESTDETVASPAGNTILMPTVVQVEDDCGQEPIWVDMTYGGLYAAGESYTVQGPAEFCLLGDANGDGMIDASDVTMLSRLLVGLIDIEDVLDGSAGMIWQACNVCDYDADLELAEEIDWWEDYLDASDVTILSRYLVGLNVTLG